VTHLIFCRHFDVTALISTTQMDDLLALFEESVEDTSEDASLSSISRPVDRSASGPRVRANTQPSNDAQRPSVGVDDRIGIRMLNRKVSSEELTDLITDFPYHSTSQLSAYSLSQLNTFLLDPAAVIDAATVNGKTNLVTIGIVFTNSGSRVGPSGKAYCMLTIGQLATGPTVSLLLFGACYHAHCRTMHPGKVVALINPRLLSPKASPAVGMKTANSRTTITFSVSDDTQLRLVADARDFGCCKAILSSKNEIGQWVKNGAFCKNYIDTRTGNFCLQHRNQAIVSNGRGPSNTTSSVREKPSSLQQLRVQAAAFPTATGAMLHSTKALSLKQPLLFVPGKSQIGNRAVGLLDPSKLRKPSYATENPLLACRPTNAAQGPSATARKQPLQGAAINPYAGRNKFSLKPPPNVAKVIAPVTATGPSRKEFLTIDLLRERKRSSAPGDKSTSALAGVKRRAVNTDSAGYHGSVPIPGPSKLFSQPKPAAISQVQIGSMFERRKNPLPNAQNILAQQELLAAQLNECKTIKASDATRNRTKASQNDKTSLKETLKENLFGSAFDTIPMEDIISAKSQFSSEADAEAYALSRKVVSELEEKEFQTNRSASRQQESSNKIEKEWICVTCKKTFSMKPMACLRMNHATQVQRKIRETKSRAEERLLLTEKNPEDGGLVLGSGLEWSRFPRFG
jgi:minichromosome maintenance protein 10